MSRKRPTRPAHSGLAKHKKKGSTLVPPLAQLPAHLVEYDRDLLPEHLWIASLVDTFGIDISHRPYYELIDAIESAWTSQDVFLGFLSDFGNFPIEARLAFKATHSNLIRAAFHEPIGRLLAFYPDGPAYWLIDNEALTADGPLNPEVEIPRLRNLVVKLYAGKDEFAGHVRTLPFGRMAKHGKIHVPKDFPLNDVIPRYPNECSAEERRLVQSFTRTFMNTLYEQREAYKERTWPKYFWRHNFDLAHCRPTVLPVRGGGPVPESDGPALASTLESYGMRAAAYLVQVTNSSRLDLYSPDRDEILLGLFSRATRLFTLLTDDPNLWARDSGGIVLRCLTECVITFCYLAKSTDHADFDRFKAFGEGQEKLLMLHLQDSYPESASMEGRTSEDIANELGLFAPELIRIELGSWSGKDTRKLAEEAGVQRLYRLIFSPSSSDVHATWMSLKHSSLGYCTEALHRFHRIPTASEPIVYVDTMIAAQLLYETAVQFGQNALSFPLFSPPLGEDLRQMSKEHSEAASTDTK